jgi:hypothetical protein
MDKIPYTFHLIGVPQKNSDKKIDIGLDLKIQDIKLLVKKAFQLAPSVDPFLFYKEVELDPQRSLDYYLINHIKEKILVFTIKPEIG